MTIAPIPNRWKTPVIKALQTYDTTIIEWKFRPKQEWQQFGLPHNAYELLIKTLKQPNIIGHDKSLEMHGAKETWAFLCEHPLNQATTLYAKIGLKDDHVSIVIFSMHTDLEEQKLEKLIQSYLSKKSNRNKK